MSVADDSRQTEAPGPGSNLAPILNVDNLKTYFFTRQGTVKAVDGVSFTLKPSETLAIVVAAVLIAGADALGLLDMNRVWVNPTYMVPGIVGGLIFIQPDYSAALTILILGSLSEVKG